MYIHFFLFVMSPMHLFSIGNFTVESCKPVIGQINNKKQATNALGGTGKLLGHFPRK